jgi:hypothetical protein
MANPTPNEAKQKAGWQYLWGLLGQPGKEAPNPKDYTQNMEEKDGMGFLGSFGKYLTKGEAKKQELQKAPSKKEKKAAGSKWNASQLQMFAEHLVIPDEDYDVKRTEYINKQAKLSGKELTKEEAAKLGRSFDNTYKRASDFYSGLNTDQSGFAPMAKLKEFSELTGIPIDPNLTDQENLYRINQYIAKTKSSGMDPFKERNSWDDPRAVSKFLQTAANSLGSFTTPEQLVFSGKGGNKTYSRHSTAQLMPVSGITSNK